jgi:hypothetical protein
MSIVLMLFESNKENAEDGSSSSAIHKRRKRELSPLSQGPKGRGRFTNVEPTIYNGEDLDVPTFTRRNVILDI